MPPQPKKDSMNTPPSSPLLEACHQLGGHQLVSQFIGLLRDVTSIDQIQELMGLLKVAEKKITQSSKLSFKEVDEIWDPKASQYKITESSKSSDEDGDKCAFVNRRRIDKKSERSTYFVDIKSTKLRDMIRTVLQRVNGISLKEDKPTIERNILYHFLPELEEYRSVADVTDVQQLDLLIGYIRNANAYSTQNLKPLLACHEITYDLVWTLFKPNDMVYSKCPGTDQPRCIRFEFGEIRTLDSGEEYFHIEGWYWDYNRHLGKAKTALGIFKFRGEKPIHSLSAFPLEYHPEVDEVKRKLISCGERFVSLTGIHHRQYQGKAFYIERGQVKPIFVDGRIMIDATLFREMNPSYSRPRVDDQRNNSYTCYFGPPKDDNVKIDEEEVYKLSRDNLPICSPTVLGYSFKVKRWLEFAVEDISDIIWNPEPFQRLAISPEKKELIRALGSSHMDRAQNPPFDDFVAGKGQGLIILLHGPPGVGKTLTAEGLSEHLEKPLYAVSSADLCIDPEKLEEKLSKVYRQAEQWNAVLLLDEADVFMGQRSLHTNDTHTTTFLRTLEYYKGIMLLTTNRLKDFDTAMLSRVHLPLHFPPLGPKTRREIWAAFHERAAKSSVQLSRKELNQLAEKDLNGRQIKNTLGTAIALASYRGDPVSYSDIKKILDIGEEFYQDFQGGSVEAMRSYT